MILQKRSWTRSWLISLHNRTVVSDTGPLIALAKLNHLELLFYTFSEIYLPQVVFTEATCNQYRPDAQRITHFVKNNSKVSVHNDLKQDEFGLFGVVLDEGEIQALALATEMRCGVLMDERLGRSIAKQHNIPVVGLMGVLLNAKSQDAIPTLKPLIETLLEENYRLSDKVIEIVLARAGE